MDEHCKIENERLIEIGKAITSSRVAIIMHNNPDPDCLAAASALQHLLKNTFKAQSSLFYGGMIGRAENRAMVSHLKLEASVFDKSVLGEFKTIALVDTQPGAGNNPLPHSVIPDIVIDHHTPMRAKTRQAAFYDVRPEFGSSSTILTRYLIAADVAIPKAIATALLYGIKTDTYDLEREAGKEDVAAYKYLLDKADRKALARIEHPLHHRSRFANMAQAFSSAEIYEDACVTMLENVEYPDITAEMADWFYYTWGIHWILAIGIEDNKKIFLSLRIRNKKRKAGVMIRQVVGKHGMAGGHDMSAGGMVPVNPPGRSEALEEADRLKRRFLRSLNIPEDTVPSHFVHNGNHGKPGNGRH